MSIQDFSKPTNYTERQMFLDPAGGVSVQRFEEFAYPKISRFEKIARGYFWNPEEITLTKDKSDHKYASDALKFIFTQNLLRQVTLDSLQGRAPAQIFTPVVSVPELEALVSNWSFYETNIHSVSYSHIIQNIYNVPKDEFNKIHDTDLIVQMAANTQQSYNDLHILNCKKELGIPVSEEEHIDAIWMALNVSYALEAIRFLASFATSFGMVESKIYMGNGAIISLIAQDELLHTEWTAYLIKQVVKDDPRFAAAKVRNEARVEAMYHSVIQEEKNWAGHLFSKGVVIGLNAPILCDFVDFTAKERLKDIGIKYVTPITSNPIPWYNKHMNISKKQTALQEQENTNYIVAGMGGDINYDLLPEL